MAVHCGVCATRIGAAHENCGSFTVGKGFDGWSARIDDTCERCAAVLAEATTKAANEIVAAHRKRVDALKDAVEEEARRRADLAEERRRFELEWAARKAEIGRL